MTTYQYSISVWISLKQFERVQTLPSSINRWLCLEISKIYNRAFVELAVAAPTTVDFYRKLTNHNLHKLLLSIFEPLIKLSFGTTILFISHSFLKLIYSTWLRIKQRSYRIHECMCVCLGDCSRLAETESLLYY